MSETYMREALRAIAKGPSHELFSVDLAYEEVT